MKKLIIVLSSSLLLAPVFAFASINNNLYYGLQKNSDVKQLQEFLINKGLLTGSATGNFFSLTLKAVKAYQTSVGINSTGYVGTLTRQAINSDLVTNLADSNEESINETNSILPAVESQKTNNDIVKSLQDQIALLLQQIVLLQSQSNVTQQLQQTAQQQAQTVNQIQQNTQQIAQNTTPVCSPNWSCGLWGTCANSQQARACADSNSCGTTAGKPSETQACQNELSLKIFSPMLNKGLGRQYIASSEIINESNYIELGLLIKKDDETFNKHGALGVDDAIVTIEATDSSQNKTLNGTGNVIKTIDDDGINKLFSYYHYHYEFKSSGEHTVTFSANGMTKSVTLNVK